MRWPWQRRPPAPDIPPYPAPVSIRETAKEEPGIAVEEHDTSSAADEDLAALRAAQSATGMHKVWRRLIGQDPPAQ